MALATRFEDLSEIIEKIKPTGNPDIKGFHCLLNNDQIECLFVKLMDGYYIDCDTTLKQFKAIFKNEPLPQGFIKVKWILLNKKKGPHQTSLREFLKAAMQFETKEPDQNTIDNCFTDSKGKRLKLSKNKSDDYTNHWKKKFKAMISP